MITLGDRIKKTRTHAQLNQIEFADKLGISSAYVSQLESDTRTQLSITLAKLISITFGINETWILTGEGEMRATVSPQASTGLTVEDIPSPTCQLVETVNGCTDIPDKWKHLKNEFLCVPLVNIEVAAGQPIMGEEYIEGWAVIHIARVKGKKDLVAVRVKGKSMEPTLRDKSIVCIDRSQKTVKNGKVYAVSLPDGSVVKRVYKDKNSLQLVSDNSDPKYRQPILVNLEDIQGHNPVVGKVIWSWTDFDGG